MNSFLELCWRGTSLLLFGAAAAHTWVGDISRTEWLLYFIAGIAATIAANGYREKGGAS